MTGPMSASRSSGFFILKFFICVRMAALRSGQTFRSGRTRLLAEHFCPLRPKAPAMMQAAASQTSHCRVHHHEVLAAGLGHEAGEVRAAGSPGRRGSRRCRAPCRRRP